MARVNESAGIPEPARVIVDARPAGDGRGRFLAPARGEREEDHGSGGGTNRDRYGASVALSAPAIAGLACVAIFANGGSALAQAPTGAILVGVCVVCLIYLNHRTRGVEIIR